MQDCCPACFIAISPGFFLESGFEIDRFVIIFYSVMICRLAFEAIIGFLASNMASIRGFPNGATRRPSWAGTEPCCSGGTQGSETSQYLQEGILRE